MAKLSFIAGLAAGYVLGARAGRQRYEQIRRTSGKVWNSGPVQKQVATAKEVARTKAAPVVADLVADAARATGEKLASSRRWRPRRSTATGIRRHPAATRTPPPRSAAGPTPWAAATSRPTAPPGTLHPGGPVSEPSSAIRTGTPATPDLSTPCGARSGAGRLPRGGTSPCVPRLPGPVPRRPLVPTPGRPPLRAARRRSPRGVRGEEGSRPPARCEGLVLAAAPVGGVGPRLTACRGSESARIRPFRHVSGGRPAAPVQCR